MTACHRYPKQARLLVLQRPSLIIFQVNPELRCMPLTQVWSCDSPHPSNHSGNSYEPGGTQRHLHAQGCTCSLSHCPSLRRTWTTHPGDHWKMAPSSNRPRVSSPWTPLWSESWRATSVYGSGSLVFSSMGKRKRVNG